ncbi:serine/threonine protein kinase [Murinocardiopsis flavida]|uniref:Serine/threonine protein kinase n=1 Tax=Murinocardiopsis flavida TaxID=645275 RepID=A0A2P8CWT4_9ACTN|nr:serine/threonine-protein kinase [Murinocardiopsis flavida]PSK89443.1 serine/threonine protein kinase [Murinocardiopsis flavida]
MHSAPDQFAAAGLAPRTEKDPTHVGGYRVVGRLGAGGMGVVYAAVDDGGAPLALKVVHRQYAADSEFRARFAREVDLLRRVTGTCVPGFRGADTKSARPWLGIEYVPGLTLKEHIDRHGPLSGDMLLGLAAGIAEALQVVHAAGIVHRDLKPGNVMLAPSGPKVLDFGIARAVEESAITRTGGLFGTPGWLAPEQYQGAEPAPQSDLFAWGGLVAYAATGRRPFGTGTPDELAIRTLEHEPDLAGLPEQLHALVAAAMAKDPARRPTATQALDAVTAMWTGGPQVTGEAATSVLPDLLLHRWTEVGRAEDTSTTWNSLAPPKRSRWRNRRVLVPVAAALALVLIGGAGAATWQLTTGDPEGGGGQGQSGGEGSGGGSGGAGGGSGFGGDDLADVDQGGANLRDADSGDDFSVGAVQVSNTSPETIEVATRQAHSDGGALIGDWEPQLTISFSAAEREGDDVVFSGSAEYLRDTGSYTLHTQDFQAMDFRLEEEDVQNLYNRDWDKFYRSTDSEVLTTLDTDKSTDDFTFTIHDVPPQNENPAASPVTPYEMRYLRYEPPEELWGHTLTEQERGAYGVCYQEGSEWHDQEPIGDGEGGGGLPCG